VTLSTAIIRHTLLTDLSGQAPALECPASKYATHLTAAKIVRCTLMLARVSIPDSDLNSTAPQSSSLESRPADQRSSVHGDAASSVTSDAMVVDNLGEAVTSASDALGRNESDRTASHEPYLYTGSTSTPGPGVRLPVSALPSAAGSNSTLTSSASANTSSVLVDDSDVTGLRLAWQQTREDLERTRGVARDMKHKFESKRAELIAAHRIEIQELKDRHHAEVYRFSFNRMVCWHVQLNEARCLLGM